MAENSKLRWLSNNRFLTALQYRDYRILWSANLFAGAAAWALIVARGWLVYDMSESSLYVGLVTFLAMIPRVIMPPISGYFADKYDRCKVMSIIFGISVTHTLFFAILILLTEISMWQVMVLAFIDGSAKSAQQPVGGALVPNLVPKDKLINAVALGQATIHGSRLIGPLAIWLLLDQNGSTTGIGLAFFLCSIFYSISLFQTLRITTSSSGSINSKESFFNNFTKALPYIYKHPQLRLIMMMAFFHCGFTMSFESVLPVISVERFDASKGSDFSLIMMAVGAGSLICIILLSSITKEMTQGHWYLYLGFTSGLAPILLAFSPNLSIALLSAILMGAAQAGYMTLTHTMMQIVTEDSVRGRVGAMYNVHIGFIMATMNLANGALASSLILQIDLPDVLFTSLRSLLAADTLLAGGGIFFILIVIISWGLKTLRTIYKTGLPLNI